MPDPHGESDPRRCVSLVLAGGLALGAYEAGAYAGLHEQPQMRPEWIAGSSIGAINAAIIAGSPPERCVDGLRRFWDAPCDDLFPVTSLWPGYPDAGPWRAMLNEGNATRALLYGRSGLFRPRLMPGPQAGARDVPALFDLAPLRARLAQLVDFDLVNNGKVRLSLCCTDVLSGDRVVFDTGRGDRIKAEHVLASSALLPFFAPVEVDGRLLGDGGLTANTPLDLVLDDETDREMLCFVVELFARQGSRPHTLAASASRASDLLFGNQTRRILDGHQRERHLRRLIGTLADHLPAEVREIPEVAAILGEGRTARATIAMVAYRARQDEAGLLKVFDFSRATLIDRWRAGEAAMRDAVAATRASPASPNV